MQGLLSWKTLVRAAEIRQYVPILDLAKTVVGEELPTITYHRKCRSIFTMKRNLDKIRKERIQCNEPELSERISSIRELPTKSTTYKQVCIFCDKVSKYAKGKDVPEKLIQCIDLRADENIRKIALAKNDSKLLAIVSRDLAAAEARYHGTCYRECTRPKPETGTSSTLSLTYQDDEFACTESAAYEKLFDYVWSNVLMTPNLTRLTDLTQTMISYMKDLSINETKESSKTRLRRKLEAEFGSLLQFEDLLGNSRVLIIPANLSRLQLGKEVERLQQLQCEGQASLIDDIGRVVLELC